MHPAATLYDSLADFIAGLSPQAMLDLRPSETVQARMEALVSEEKSRPLSHEEKDELDHYLVLERLMRLGKAHAAVKLAR